jgi:predicted enzyme related to lactoylglutathione lyase
MSTPNHHNPVGWFEIYVHDTERAKAFYEAVFNVSLIAENTHGMDMWMFPFDSQYPGCAGALVKMPEARPGPGGTLVYFSCKDCEVEAERVVRNGGQVLRPKLSIGEYGDIVIAQDTEGNVIGLHNSR